MVELTSTAPRCANVVSISCNRPERSPCCDDHDACMKACAKSRRTPAITDALSREDCHVAAIASATRISTRISESSTAVVTLTWRPATKPKSLLPSVMANAARVIETRNSASTSPPRTDVAAKEATADRRSDNRFRTPLPDSAVFSCRSVIEFEVTAVILPRRGEHYAELTSTEMSSAAGSAAQGTGVRRGSTLW